MATDSTIAALKAGDVIIFRETFTNYHEKVYFFIFSKCHNHYTAEEVTQITFIKLWQYRESLDDALPIISQLFRIAKTSFIDLHRKEHRQHLLLQKAKDQPVIINAGDDFDHKELLKRVAGMIEQMPPVRKKVFELSRKRGMSYKEISATTSLSIKTVENHIYLAIKQLKGLLLLLIIWACALFY